MQTTSSNSPKTPGLVLKNRDLYGIFDPLGDVDTSIASDRGLYLGCTRFLSRYRLRLMGMDTPIALSSSVGSDNTTLFTDLTNPPCKDYEGQRLKSGSLYLHRELLLYNTEMHEKLTVQNQTHQSLRLRLVLEWAADFRDLFEIRGCQRNRRGKRLDPADGDREEAYRGLDDVLRRTRFSFLNRDNVTYHRGRAECVLHIEPLAREVITMGVLCSVTPATSKRRRSSLTMSRDFLAARTANKALIDRFQADAARVRSKNEAFHSWIAQSAADLELLITETEHGYYPYAGVPWFCAPFGRDGIIVAFQTLWFAPRIARGVLGFLAKHQGQEEDPVSECQPGKILHEKRFGEMVALGELPYGCYYGTADATLLFVWLLGAYVQTTGDLSFLQEQKPALEKALHWMDHYGDGDGDGFFDYTTMNLTGLLHQGWKDADDAVTHADGTLADPPVALCELQGYAYRAWQEAATLWSLLGDPAKQSQCLTKATRLKSAFHQAFWKPHLGQAGAYALALTRGGKPAEVLSSNTAHCLFSGIAEPEEAALLSHSLSDRTMFTGWGLRTLAANAAAYSPLSYHNGSVWPHDNAIAMAGLSVYGQRALAEKLFEGIFRVSRHFNNRLPELFAGFDRRRHAPPIRYPNACSPQAWASGTPFLMLRGCLGLNIDGFRREVRFEDPWLPKFLHHLELHNLRVGSTLVDITVERRGHTVDISSSNQRGPVSVVLQHS